jgi:putative MATE family efflux protein
MTEDPLLRVILGVALPIAASSLLQTSYQLVNMFWVGRLDAHAIAAVAASGPIFWVLISLGSGLSTAGAVLIAQYSGARQAEKVDHVAAQTLLMVAGVATAFTLFGVATAYPALRFLGVDAEIRRMTAIYLWVSYLGMIPMFGFMAIQVMLQSVGEVKFAFRVMLASVVLNAALDPFLIFGFGGWEGWGVHGAAAATDIAQTIAMALGLYRVLSGRSALHLRPAHFKPDLPHMRRALGIGLPASIEQGTRTFSSLLLMAMTAQFGAQAIATYGMASRVLFFWFTPMLGFSIATAAVVGQNIGANRMDRAEAAGKLGAWLSFVVFTVIGLVLTIFMRPIMALLAPGAPEIIDEAVVFGYAVAPFMGVVAVPQILCGVFRGAGSTKQSMAISLAMQWLFQLPAAYFLSFHTPLGVRGIWWCYAVGNSVAAILAIAWFKWGPWRRSLI